MKAAGLEATTLGPTAVAQRHQAQAQLAGGQGHRIAADRGCGGAVISRQRASFERHLHGSGSAAWTCDIVGEASAAKQVFELEGLAAVLAQATTGISVCLTGVGAPEHAV